MVVCAVAVLASSVTGAGAAQAAPVSARTGVFVPIRNNQTGLCLQPETLDEFAQVVQEPCNGQPMQGWLFQRVTGTRYKFINQADGLCLDEFDRLAIGARVLMGQCVRISNEEWQTHVTLPFFAAPLESRSGNTDTEFCAEAGFGRAILMTGCTGTTFQTWNIGA
ncbi:RICIN domain-containing protein [Actinoplanes nipponensis]|nr:RICIN domain-containing protein [Actinoplanes nipponensis]